MEKLRLTEAEQPQGTSVKPTQGCLPTTDPHLESGAILTPSPEASSKLWSQLRQPLLFHLGEKRGSTAHMPSMGDLAMPPSGCLPRAPASP